MPDTEEIRLKYFPFEQEPHRWGEPCSKKELLKHIDNFMRGRESDDPFGVSFAERVKEGDYIELNWIFQAIIASKWDAGHKGRDLPVEFKLNNLATHPKMPYLPMPRDSAPTLDHLRDCGYYFRALSGEMDRIANSMHYVIERMENKQDE